MGIGINQAAAGIPPTGWTLLDQVLVPVGAGPNWTGLDGESDYLYKVVINTTVKGGGAHGMGVQLNGITTASYNHILCNWGTAGTAQTAHAADTKFNVSSAQSVGESCNYEMYIQGYSSTALGLVCFSNTNGSTGDAHFCVGDVTTTDPLDQINFVVGLSSSGGAHYDGDLFQLWAARPPR